MLNFMKALKNILSCKLQTYETAVDKELPTQNYLPIEMCLINFAF